jgi:hypothetical protein
LFFSESHTGDHHDSLFTNLRSSRIWFILNKRLGKNRIFHVWVEPHDSLVSSCLSRIKNRMLSSQFRYSVHH